MKKRIQTPLMATVAALAVGFVSPAFADTDCDKASSKFAAAVASKPDELLTLLAETVAKNESCSCEVVQAAIKAVGADKAKVGDIVFTAVSVAPSMATTITECAVAAAPKATSEIKAALKSALSDKGSASYGKEVAGKNPGKDVVEEPAVEDDGGFDFGRAPLDVRGIYLLAPSPGGGFVTETVVEIIERVKIIHRGGGGGGGGPVTPSDPKPVVD